MDIAPKLPAIQSAIGLFSANDLTGWESRIFHKETQYELVADQNKGSTKVLRAISNASASALFKKQHIDLFKTPFLSWRWKITQRIPSDNETIKSQDDYAARIYVIIKGGFFMWNSMALNYVWANGLEKGRAWGSAYATKRSQMIAIRSNEDKLNQWYYEKRNVRQDFEVFFGKQVRYIDVLAIMTDTDNTASSAKSYYGDIFFSEQ